MTTFRLVPAASALPPVASEDTAGAAAGTTATVAGGAAMAAPAVETSPILADAPWLAPAPARGTWPRDPTPRRCPADILIADHLNNRLLIIDPQGRVRWQFPRPGDLAPGQTFLAARRRVLQRGREVHHRHPGRRLRHQRDQRRHQQDRLPVRDARACRAAGPNHLNNPDDALLAPGGHIVAADIKNCRIVTIAPPAHRLLHVLGQTTNRACTTRRTGSAAPTARSR